MTKKIGIHLVFIIGIVLISFVSAHTGNDYSYHGMEFFDWFLLGLLIVGVIFLIKWIIKKK